jgi:hypothetical protein
VLRKPIILLLLLPAAVVLAAAGCGGGGSGTTASEQSFRPQASLRAVGGTQRTDKPSFQYRVVTRPGDANIRSVAVTLPKVVLVDAVAIGELCTKKELQADHCAGHQRLGFARVQSPAYQATLSGPVYAVAGYGALPHLAYVLNGPAEILLQGRVVSTGGRIQAGVDDVPDTPVKSFELTIDGGKHGYLVLSRNICGAEFAADSRFASHDGEVLEEETPLQASCG